MSGERDLLCGEDSTQVKQSFLRDMYRVPGWAVLRREIALRAVREAWQVRVDPPLLPGDELWVRGVVMRVKTVNVGMLLTGWPRDFGPGIEGGLMNGFGGGREYVLGRPVAVVHPPEAPKKTFYLILGVDHVGRPGFQSIEVTSRARGRLFGRGEAVMNDGGRWEYGMEVEQLGGGMIVAKKSVPEEAVYGVSALRVAVDELLRVRRGISNVALPVLGTVGVVGFSGIVAIEQIAIPAGIGLLLGSYLAARETYLEGLVGRYANQPELRRMATLRFV